MPTEDAYSSGHLVLSHLGFANVLLLRSLTLHHTLHHQFMTLSLIWLLIEFDTFRWFDTTNPWPCTRFDFLLNLTLLIIGFHGANATGVACRQGTLTPPDTWSCPTLWLASVLMLRPISPELVLFLDFWVSNIPRYFCFCFPRMANYCIKWLRTYRLAVKDQCYIYSNTIQINVSSWRCKLQRTCWLYIRQHLHTLSVWRDTLSSGETLCRR